VRLAMIVHCVTIVLRTFPTTWMIKSPTERNARCGLKMKFKG
jgi:hypothetical protein